MRSLKIPKEPCVNIFVQFRGSRKATFFCIMTFLDKYKDCRICPVRKYCGTMVSSIRLCNSYKNKKWADDELKNELIK